MKRSMKANMYGITKERNAMQDIVFIIVNFTNMIICRDSENKA